MPSLAQYACIRCINNDKTLQTKQYICSSFLFQKKNIVSLKIEYSTYTCHVVLQVSILCGGQHCLCATVPSRTIWAIPAGCPALLHCAMCRTSTVFKLVLCQTLVGTRTKAVDHKSWGTRTCQSMNCIVSCHAETQYLEHVVLTMNPVSQINTAVFAYRLNNCIQETSSSEASNTSVTAFTYFLLLAYLLGVKAF
jgi:hypothetical protein